ncbi:MAG: UTP--glucose-1-phosphate uridylyltransferase [Pirellulaceae bacterium]
MTDYSLTSHIRDRLADHGQVHLLQFVDELENGQLHQLIEQIETLDLDQIADLHKSFGQPQQWSDLAARAEPPLAVRLNDSGDSPFTRDEAIQRGQQLLADNKVAVIIVAGGQGSRLGFHHPKGMFPLGPVSKRTLFQIHIDKLRALNQRYGVIIPLYLMTSPATHEETDSFLRANNWFGYPPDHVRLFCQGTMPAVDADSGKLLLAGRDQLFLGPDGHGGMLAALEKSGCLADLKSRGIENVFYCQVDNPLCQIGDAATLGYHLLAKSELTTQAVPKREALQKVGNIVSIDGQVQIIEYSDLQEEVARQTCADGSLKLWAGNIAVHVFNVDFLDRMTGHADALPFHLAHKKVSFIDSAGKLVEPEQPNAVKFERFIFDLLPMAGQAIVVEVDPQEAFSPVKNAASEKSETAQTAQQSMIDLAKRRLAEIDVQVAEGVAIEIDPVLAHDTERLTAKTAGLSPIREPMFLH